MIFGKEIDFKKIIVILLLITIIGVIVFCGVKKIGGNNSTKTLRYMFDPNQPILIYDNGKYGYVTSKGKMMIEPQYENAEQFIGDYAIVSVKNPDEDAYYRYIYQLIDKKGNVKLDVEGSKAPTYIAEYDMWLADHVLYDSKLKEVFSEGVTVEYLGYGYFTYYDEEKNEGGIITHKGKKIFSAPGESVYVSISENSYDEDELYASVTIYTSTEQRAIISLKNGKTLFNVEGAYRIGVEEDGIFYVYDDSLTDGYKNKKFLFYINNKAVYESTEYIYDLKVYDYDKQILEIDYGYDYKDLGKKDRYAYYDVKNKKMLDKKPSLSNPKIGSVEEKFGFEKFNSSDKYGLLSNGEIIVPCEYDDIDFLSSTVFEYMKSKGKEFVLLDKDDQILLYDLAKSKVVETFDTGYVYVYSNSTFINYKEYDDDSQIKNNVVYNLLTGEKIKFAKDEEITVYPNYIYVKKDGKRTYYNTELKQVYELMNK